MILTQTPLRVSLFGGGTDYPAYFNQAPGAVLGMAIDRYCYVGVKHMPPGQEQTPGNQLRYRVQYSKVDNCQTVEDIHHPAVRCALQYFEIDTPLEFHCFGDLPGRSGLGGSSAFTVGLVHALHKLGLVRGNHQALPYWLARIATHIEQNVIQETVGCQDQIFAAYGGLNLVEFRQEGNVITRLNIPADRLAELANSLVLVYSGTMRDAHVMAAKQVEQIPAKTVVLRKMAQMAYTGVEILQENRSLEAIGKLLNAAWSLKCQLCPEVSNDQIHQLYQRGIAAGAIGGKLLGAGGGGFMLFYVPPDRRLKFEREIAAPCVGFQAAMKGSSVILDY